MNKLRFLTSGESHGPAEVAILEGIPAGLDLEVSDIQKELEKRRSGAGRGGRGKIETDQVKILSGVRFGKTLGSPIALLVENLDFINWQEKMTNEKKVKEYQNSISVATPRPGHADLPGLVKYAFDDIRNVLERASARETIMRVAVGAVCKVFLKSFGTRVASHTTRIGKIAIPNDPVTFTDIENVYVNDPDIRCVVKDVSRQMKEEIILATKKKDTLGGVVEIRAIGIPVGIGSYVHYDKKLDSQIAQALMSIPSVKAVEIGEGITNCEKFGSNVQDEILYENNHFVRKTNRAGGIEGGISNGEEIVLRVFHKPISTIGNPLNSVDIKTKISSPALIERSDICVVPRAGIVSESMLSFVLANGYLDKFGGDSMDEILRNFEGYKNYITTV